MAARRSIHDVLERTGLPLLIIVLVPAAVILYLLFSGTVGAPAQSAPAQTATQSASDSLPPANIFLDDPSSLPTSVTAAELVPFSFTVQNTSDANATYQYKVAVQWSTGEEDVIDENTLALSAGASTTIPEQLKFEIATETAEVYLELPQTAQTVQFALPRAN